MKYVENSSAFTFIELIISIIILAIIGFISFFTINKNLETTRNSYQVISLNNIKTTLINYKLNNGLYPDPTNYINITHSGSNVWYQGIFGKDVIEKVKGSKEKFFDPITNNSYTYSISNTKRDFQIAGVLNYISYNNFFLNSYANSKIKGRALVLGDYNGHFIKTTIEGIDNILAVPSLISSDLSYNKLIDIINFKKLVYNGSTNLPASYKDSIFEVNGGQNLSFNKLLLFSGSISTLKVENNRLILLNDLKNSYKGTLLESLGDKKFQNINIDFINPSNKVLSLACDIVQFELKYPIGCSNDNFFAVPIFSNLNLLNIDFSGLISQKVNTVIQDSNNNLWFGTDKGLSKYSSGMWTSYTQSNGLVNNKVKTIIQSSNGDLWFGTKGGISVFNSGSFTSYTQSNGLVNNEVKTIMQSSNGNIWIATKGGVSVFNSGSFTSYTQSNGLVNNQVKTILQSSNGNIWIATKGGISVFNSGSFTSYTQSNGLVNNEAQSIMQSSSGSMWVATEKGISVFNPVLLSWSSYNSVLVSSDVKNIFQSNDNKIWVATDKGVSMFDGISWYQYTVTDGLISNKVKDIFQDNSQNMWFITKKGLSKLVSGSFTNYPNGNNQGIYVVYQSNGITIIGIK